MNGVLNATLNATMNATNHALNTTAPVVTSASQWLSSIFIPTLVDRLVRLIAAPLEQGQMLYIITPMLITLLLMEFYFGHYDREELGWNTAVGHALVLIFVSVDLTKTIYPTMAPSTMLIRAWYNLTHLGTQSGEAISTLITAVIFAIGILFLVTNFFHWLPKKFAFILSGTLEINLIAYLSIVIVYTNNAGANPMPVDGYTLLAALMLFVALWFLFGIIHLLEPKYKGKKKKMAQLSAEAPDPNQENTLFTNE